MSTDAPQPTQGPNYWAPPTPPTPPTPSAPPPAPQKSWFARHKIITGLLALVLLGSVGSALGGGGDAPTVAAAASDQPEGAERAPDAAPAEPEAKAVEPDAPAKDVEPAQQEAKDAADVTAGIGTAVRDGQFEFTITKVEKNVASVGSEYLNEKAQGKYVILHVTVKNIGEKAQLLSDSSQKVRDGSGREFSTDTTAGIYLEDNKVFFNEINPGNSVKGKLVFDMPKDAKAASVELHDSPFSDGVSVSLS